MWFICFLSFMFEKIRKYNFWHNEPIKTGYKRKAYLEKLAGYLNNSLIKVITGQRRCGKSYLFRAMIRHLIEERGVSPTNILYINMEMQDLSFITDNIVLFSVIREYREKLHPKGTVYVFLDEVQEIANWEKAVVSLSQDYSTPYELFLTGSNAHLLSHDIATLLTGRHIRLEVFPFSYCEVLEITEKKRTKASFINYLKKGGMPECYNFNTTEIIGNYLSSLKDSIVLHDIVERYNIRDIHLLQRLFHFCIDTIGSLFSINKIVHYLISTGYKTNVETISNYLSFLEHAYLIHESQRYDIQGKRILSGERKYYLNDLGFKYYLTSSFDFGIGKYLENAVFLHFKRKGYHIYTGKHGDQEVDFIVGLGNEKMYVQVAYILADESTITREFRVLERIRDNFHKIVISLDDMALGNRAGIRHVRAWELIE